MNQRVGLVLLACSTVSTLRSPSIAFAPLRHPAMPRPRLLRAPVALTPADVSTNIADISSAVTSLQTVVLASPVLLRDSVCMVAVVLAAAVWVDLWSGLASKGRLPSTLSRKLIHTGSAPLFLICWPLFSEAPSARVAACAVPLLQVVRLVRAGLSSGQSSGAAAHSSAEGGDDVGAQPEAALVAAVSRSGERSEALGGPLLYTLVLLSATAFGWRSPVAAVAICQMAVGDGVADIFGTHCRLHGATKHQSQPAERDESRASYCRARQDLSDIVEVRALLGSRALGPMAGATRITSQSVLCVLQI